MREPLDMEALAKECGIDLPTQGEIAAKHARTIGLLRAALKKTTETLIKTWGFRDLAPDDELELVKTNLEMLKD